MLDINTTDGYEADIARAITAREEQEMRRKVDHKEGLEVYGIMNEGIEL